MLDTIRKVWHSMQTTRNQKANESKDSGTPAKPTIPVHLIVLMGEGGVGKTSISSRVSSYSPARITSRPES
jgi:putative ribosome biogenesis GTPase RsgA